MSAEGNKNWVLPTGDPEKGKILYAEICASCHTVEPGRTDRSGPNLSGIWGRQAGTLPGYKFAESDEKKGITWNDRSLWDYFERGHIPGTRMFFRALHRNHQKRADVLAYLKIASSPQK
ncbi:cytochrome c-like [Lytechinus variegatus]|uniref:cytochrome c-like n=1 Tax=Lytechinus variegatus TaxID=7654 RepID=UPI001BB1D36C|nr:cytochrome c-like [Lytechinus variegatus]